MAKLIIALDKSVRSFDTDGRLHLQRSHISKAAINPYYGKEIPGYEELGLEPDKVYKLYRDPEELEKAAGTFARIPILSEHVPVTVDSPKKELIIGSIGSDVSFNNPYLDADLAFWDADAIAGIETDKIKELSCAYHYLPIMEPGEAGGQPYDGRITQIKGNHLALVEVGRAGADVVVADENPFKKEKIVMQMTKLGKALFVAIGATSPVLAADSALPALVGRATRRDFDKAEVLKKLLALDAEVDSEKVEEVIEALLDVEEDPMPNETPEAEDESPADKIKALLNGKVDEEIISQIVAMLPVGDEDMEEKEEAEDGEEKPMKKEEVKAAMDSLRKELRQAEEARRDVSDIVGDVMAIDSAPDIYAFALDHMGVDHKGVKGVAALRALYRVASNKKPEKTPSMAHDSKGLVEKFPGVARFKSA